MENLIVWLKTLKNRGKQVLQNTKMSKDYRNIKLTKLMVRLKKSFNTIQILCNTFYEPNIKAI